MADIRYTVPRDICGLLAKLKRDELGAYPFYWLLIVSRVPYKQEEKQEAHQNGFERQKENGRIDQWPRSDWCIHARHSIKPWEQKFRSIFFFQRSTLNDSRAWLWFYSFYYYIRLCIYSPRLHVAAAFLIFHRRIVCVYTHTWGNGATQQQHGIYQG